MKDIFGLAVLAWPLTLGVLILLAFAVAIALTTRYAKRTGRSKWRWGLLGFLVVFLPIFWDWIPTVVAHQYYCSTEAGFWIYKTLDQWKQENPGVMEGLAENRVWPSEHIGDMDNYVTTKTINQRFVYVDKKNGPLVFRRWRHEQMVLDSQIGTTLARQVDFSTGNGLVGGEPEIRFWIHSDGCVGSKSQAIAFVTFVKKFKGTEK